MEHYVGLDVSLKLTAICVVDQTGSVTREGVVDFRPRDDCRLRDVKCTKCSSDRA